MAQYCIVEVNTLQHIAAHHSTSLTSIVYWSYVCFDVTKCMCCVWSVYLCVVWRVIWVDGNILLTSAVRVGFKSKDLAVSSTISFANAAPTLFFCCCCCCCCCYLTTQLELSLITYGHYLISNCFSIVVVLPIRKCSVCTTTFVVTRSGQQGKEVIMFFFRATYGFSSSFIAAYGISLCWKWGRIDWYFFGLVFICPSSVQLRFWH
mgnify:CR=1 FL=1